MCWPAPAPRCRSARSRCSTGSICNRARWSSSTRVLERGLPAIRRAFLTRIYAVHTFTGYLRATAWLGAIAAGASEPARLRARIQRVCNGLGGDAVTRSVPLLVGGGLAVLRGDLDTAVERYRSAATSFDGADMLLTA